MNVAFLTREYSPDTAWGGIATMYHVLACALADRGHEVHVICQAVGEAGDLVDSGVYVHRVGTNARRYSAMARLNYSLSAWRKLKAVIERHDIEIVEAAYWGAEGLLYSLSRRTPLVIRVATSASDILRTGTYSGKREWVALKVLSCLEGISARRADRVVATTSEIYNTLLARLRGGKEKVDLVRHAIDTDKYCCIESGIRERLNISPDAPLVVFVGRLEARKGVHILCQAIPAIIDRMPLTKFVLVGRDTDTSPGGGSVKGYIAEHADREGFGDNLIFIDFMTESELVEIYSASDLVVSPSLHESFGLVTLEAMACGKPVVATSTGLVPELEIDGAGLTKVSPGNAGELADAVVNTLSLSDEDRETVSRVNRRIVEAEFSVSQWVDNVLGVYERAVQERIRRKGGSR